MRSCANEHKLAEIEQQLRDRGFTITVLTETKLPTNTYKVNEHSTLHNSGPDANNRSVGGVGFLTRNADASAIMDVEYISYRIAKLTIKVGDLRLGIIGCYAPTECSENEYEKDAFYEQLQREAERLFQKTDEVIIMGDFNCRISKEARIDQPRIVGPHADAVETTENGYRVMELCHALGLRVENTFFDKPSHKKATWYHPCTKKGSMLDLVLSRNSAHLQALDVRASRGAEANSDHMLLTSVFRINGARVSDVATRKPSNNRKRCWKDREVALSISRNRSIYQDIMTENLISCSNLKDLTDSMATSIKKYMAKVRTNRTTQKRLSRKLHRAIKEKHKARQLWLSENSESSYNFYREKRSHARSVSRLEKEAAIEQLFTEFTQLTEANEQRLANEKLNEALKLATGKWWTMKKEQNTISNELLRKHYQQLFMAVTPDDLLRDEWCKLEEDNKEEDLNMTNLEIVLKTMENGKSPGMNGIRGETIKYGGELLKESLLTLYNRYWRGEADLPNEWRDSEVVSIYKRSGSKKDPNNYRSIFLLDVIGKIFSGLVCQRLLAYSEPTLSDTQMGFRRYRSTMQAIVSLRHLIQNAIDQHTPLVMTFVDLKKAFDSVPHRAIYESLKSINCSSRVNNCIMQMMKQSIGHLRGGKEMFTMERGVRQGSKEGPHLFNIVFDSILKKVSELTNKGTFLISENGEKWVASHIEYADDLCLLTNSVDDMEEILTVLDDTLLGYGMEISFTKTKWMSTTQVPDEQQLSINGKSIDRVTTFKYLGSIINANGDSKPAVRENIKRARTGLIKLRPALRSNKISTQIKSRMVECFIKPILLYGLETIVLTAQSNDKMEAMLNTARRMILGLNNKRDLKVDLLKNKVILKPIATQLRRRRVNLWLALNKTGKNAALRMMKSSLVDKRCFRVAHTKRWMRQMYEDAKECTDGNPEQWINYPTPVSIKKIQATRPKLVGKRERKIKCTAKGCARMFAYNNEMYRHLRNDHSMAINSGDKPIQCPVSNCYKTFKITGWLKSHISKCHPRYKIKEIKKNIHQVGQASTSKKRNSETHQCPDPNCTKETNTKKGIINHCYQKHGFSTTTITPTVQRKRQTAMRVP
ncbi:MAG: reverse transcriptase domain-containing protein [Candidatus Thiodiazotropha sp.]